MTHHDKTIMKDNEPTGQTHNSTASDAATATTGGTTKMKDAAKMDPKEGHMMMMNGHTSEGGHGGMMEGGSTGGMNH
jgi:hypothetical protein